MQNDDLISRSALLAAYDAAHKGPPGGARKLIEEAPGVDGWISVKDRLPEEDVYVLAHTGVAPFIAAHTTNPSNRWYAISGFTICPTHWMPLPEPPKEDNDAEQ